MKHYFRKKIKYILLFSLITFLLTIILIQNKKVIKKPYIIAEENDILNNQNEVEIYIDTYHENLLQLYKDKKLLVLTFDDGPGKYTDYLVDELNKRNIPATFFILGSNINGFEDVLLKTSKTHEIAIHSYSHKLFTKLSNEEILEDILKTKNLITEITSLSPNVIRVPYGSTNTRVSTLLFENGYTSVKWDIDSKDWSFRNVDKIYNYVMKNIKGNSIILMHDIYKTSVDAAIKLVDTLKDEYTFVTISTYLEICEEIKN